MMTKTQYKAIVQKVIEDGKHGPYVVTRSKELGTVTYSLAKSVWQEKRLPEPGEHVVLSQVVQKRAGWRAHRSRYFQLGDAE